MLLLKIQKDSLVKPLNNLINIVERRGVTLKDCMELAYGDIKDRTGVMRDGIFIKDQ